MKFGINLFNALLLLCANQTIAHDVEVFDGIKIAKFSVSDALGEMRLPVNKSASGVDIPAHMQYIIGLDQYGSVDPDGEGLKSANIQGDPEFGTTLSAGDITEHKSGFTQKINRCYGNGWTFFETTSEEIKSNDKLGKLIAVSGKEFLGTILTINDGCKLTFEWNKNKTKAKITGYFGATFGAGLVEQLGKGLGSTFGKFLGRIAESHLVALTIELQPYWQWKFGLSKGKGHNSSKMEALDAKCCPPKDYFKSCTGYGKLGKKGDKCETISMACGEIKNKVKLTECAMYERVSANLPYYVYPLSDIYGNKTPYNELFVDAMEANGVKKLFKGVDLATD